ncbi:Protein quiver [Caenorhabditis elegans]|uniref:Protein quiver n=1 Tax=Caenorhabditis elegans TaxID=6239 RepID=A2V8C6_CAEEL|nr:Protein quiver [Caenorhabditis elegans]CCD74190.1 Protein quiver [Caenorhabditis elegans]|eukprot:NP_001122828.1 Uncharacterized protein CELE_Y73B6BL.47 [Caenorhabditis elegans]
MRSGGRRPPGRRREIQKFLELSKKCRLFTMLILLLTMIQPTSSLTCLTCMYTSSTTQLDNFRVSTRLSRPQCSMEPIKCDRDQDVCVTITMHVGGGDYWMGAGCDRRVNFQHMSCQNVRTMSRNVQLGYVQERRAMQRVCVCARDLCNQHSNPFQLPVILIFLLSFLFIFQL